VRKQVTLVILLMVGFAGAGSSAVLTRALAQPKSLSAVQQEKRLGPKPIPHWYWRWVEWRLGEGFAKGHRRQFGLRPSLAPERVQLWAWRRLHFFLLARGASSRPVSSGSGGEVYKKATSYTRQRPSFSPTRTIEVRKASQLQAAIANLQPGDLVKATANFTVSGITVIRNRLSSPAELDLSGVRFIFSGGSNHPAVAVENAKNLYIYGGNISTAGTGGACLIDHGSQHVLWWGFTVHNCGGSGFTAQAVGGPVDHDDFQGTISKVGQNLAWDPHSEKGTGEHGANLWDANQIGNFTNNRFAFNMHDIPTGACVEFGNDQPLSQATGNVLYLRCVNATKVAVRQGGGNALQCWGDTITLGLDVKYIEGDNLQGHAFWAGGVYPGQNLRGVTIEYGRASRTNLNPRYAGQSPWDRRYGVAYGRVRTAR
jgi:hypothetical protein